MMLLTFSTFKFRLSLKKINVAFKLDILLTAGGKMQHNKRTILSVLLISALVMFLCAVGQTAELQTPKFEIANDTFIFPDTLEGTMINHDFILKNNGSETVKIESVNPGCGCTTVDFTKEIAPGKEGKISIRFDSSGYGGHVAEKSITVTTSSSEKSSFELNIKGVVEKFADISKTKVAMKGKPGENLYDTVTITPRKDNFFKILEIKAASGEHIAHKLTSEDKNGKKSYVLTIINLKKTPGKYFDRLSLKTDSKIHQYITIGIFGVIEDSSEVQNTNGKAQ